MAEQAGKRILVHLDKRPEGAQIARVVIDNEKKLNTLNRALMKELIVALEALAVNQALRVVVLAGAGEKAFIGGADIDEMATLNPATAREFIILIHKICEGLRTLPVPVIARLQGYTLGAGMEIAAACDLRVAAKSARLGMPEVQLGIPSVLEAALLPGLIGWGRTRELLLTGETFTSTEAERWGFVNRVVPAAALDDAVERWIQALLAARPAAVRQQKQLIRNWEDLPLREAVLAGIDAFAQAYETDDPNRTMASFHARSRAHHKS